MIAAVATRATRVTCTMSTPAENVLRVSSILNIAVFCAPTYARISAPHSPSSFVLQVLGFYKEKSGAAKGSAEGIQRTTQIAINEASSYSTIPPEKVVRLQALPLMLLLGRICSAWCPGMGAVGSAATCSPYAVPCWETEGVLHHNGNMLRHIQKLITCAAGASKWSNQGIATCGNGHLPSAWICQPQHGGLPKDAQEVRKERGALQASAW